MINLMSKGSPYNAKLLKRFALYLLAGLLSFIWFAGVSSGEPLADLRITTEDGTLVVELEVAGEPSVTPASGGENGGVPAFTIAGVDAADLIGGSRSEMPTGFVPAPMLRVIQEEAGVKITFPGAVAGLKCDWRCTEELVRLALFTGENPLPALDVSGKPGDSGAPVIHKISHRSEAGMDIFTISFRGEIPEPNVRLATDGLWITFDGCTVDLPAGVGGEFSTPVQGEMMGRLDIFVNDSMQSRIGLIPIPGERFSYEVIFDKGSDFIVRCYKAPAPPPVTPVIEKPAPEKIQPVEITPPPVKEPLPPPVEIAAAKVVKVKYDPIGNVDRFTFSIDGHTPQVNVQQLTFPDRIKITFKQAEVELPETSHGTFETPVPGIGIANMVAINTVAGEVKSADFTFSLAPLHSVNDIEVKVDSSRPDKIVVDVCNTTLPEPVKEVTKAVPEPPPVEPPPVEETEAAQPEKEPAKEDIAAPPVQEKPVVEEKPAPEEKPVIEEKPLPEEKTVPEEKPVTEEKVTVPIAIEPVLEPARIPISVNLTTLPDGGAMLSIKADKPFDKPRIKCLSYPTRLSLGLPYSTISFRGDKSGSWNVNEPTVTMLTAVDDVNEEAERYNSSLIINIARDVENDRVKAEIRPAGYAAYDIVITILPEIAPPAPPAVKEPKPTAPEVTIEKETPVEKEVAIEKEVTLEKEPEAVVEPVPEPQEVEVPEGDVEIKITVEPVSEPQPTPPFVEPKPEEKPAPPPEPESKPAVPEKIEAPKPGGKPVEMISPLPVSTEKPAEGISYPTFKVDVQPAVNGVDRFVLNFTSAASEPEVQRFGHPPRLMLVFNNVQPDFSESRNPYDFHPIAGGVIANRYKLAQSNDDCPPKGILEIDATAAESPDQIGYRINKSGSSVVVEVFPLALTKPGLEPLKTPVEKLDVIPPLPKSEMIGELPPAVKEAIAKAPIEDVEPEGLKRKPGAEPLVSINVKDANIVDVLQVICTQAEINNIIDPSVVGRVSLTLTDTPLSVVLELLGEQADFDYYIKYGIYNFAKESVLERKFPEFYGTWIIEMAFADPNQLRTILSTQGIVDAKNLIVYNPQAVGGGGAIFTANRKLLIRASEKDIKLALAIVREMDVPPPQIVYNVKIIQASANIRKNLGVNWLTNTTVSENQGTMGFGLQEKPVSEPGVGGGITEFFPQGLMRDQYTFNATLNYLENQGKAKILANPSISALNGQSATYFVGQSVPYRSTFQVSDIGRVTQRVAQEQVGITLNVTGIAASNNTVTMYIAPEISNLLELTDIGPRTSKNRFSTVMRVSDGETFVMAGLINEEDRIAKSKVPILGDMPLVGGLFKNKKTDIDRTELIIAITPHIINPVDYLGPVVRRATGLEELFTGGK